jgi:hypothetical protein
VTGQQVRPLHVYVPPGSRWVVLRGPVRELLAEAGVHSRWSNALRGREVAADQLPDLLALADARGFLVRIHPKAAS